MPDTPLNSTVYANLDHMADTIPTINSGVQHIMLLQLKEEYHEMYLTYSRAASRSLLVSAIKDTIK